MTQSAEDRALLIKKLLNKAEARGTTEAEADAFTAKATALMIQWGIDDALVHDADRVKVEQIIRVEILFTVPKSYSYEYAGITIGVANAMGCRGLFMKKGTGFTVAVVIGFESDVERVRILAESLTLQCTMALGVTFANESLRTYWSGTDKFNWKRSFIRGFDDGASRKLRDSRKTVIADAAPGTDLVLVDRAAKVTNWIDENMRIGVGRARRYVSDGAVIGRSAGRNANIGGSQLGGSSRAVGK
jgi:hypothetical protein